jgi:tRNA(Arg) A34 adenosine deaminase TadA
MFEEANQLEEIAATGEIHGLMTLEEFEQRYKELDPATHAERQAIKKASLHLVEVADDSEIPF